MAKKRKHYKTCMHCAFMHAFYLKYGQALERNDSEEAFTELVTSAIKITALVFTKISLEDQREFMGRVAEQSGSIDRMKEMVENATRGPTKH